jgi:hypothetical protein
MHPAATKGQFSRPRGRESAGGHGAIEGALGVEAESWPSHGTRGGDPWPDTTQDRPDHVATNRPSDVPPRSGSQPAWRSDDTRK